MCVYVFLHVVSCVHFIRVYLCACIFMKAVYVFGRNYGYFQVDAAVRECRFEKVERIAL